MPNALRRARRKPVEDMCRRLPRRNYSNSAAASSPAAPMSMAPRQPGRSCSPAPPLAQPAGICARLESRGPHALEGHKKVPVRNPRARRRRPAAAIRLFRCVRLSAEFLSLLRLRWVMQHDFRNSLKQEYLSRHTHGFPSQRSFWLAEFRSAQGGRRIEVRLPGTTLRFEASSHLVSNRLGRDRGTD